MRSPQRLKGGWGGEKKFHRESWPNSRWICMQVCVCVCEGGKKEEKEEAGCLGVYRGWLSVSCASELENYSSSIPTAKPEPALLLTNLTYFL